MKNYDLNKPNRLKKAERMRSKDYLPKYYTKVLRKGVDGKPDYVLVVPVRKALRLLNPDIKRSREYKFIGRE